MPQFPNLKSGAVTQYPTGLNVGQNIQVIRYLDGSDQRFSRQSKQFRRWRIDLSLLDEQELDVIEKFFDAQEGEYPTFSFPDPISGTVVINCRFGMGQLTTDYVAVDSGATTIWVIETNG